MRSTRGREIIDVLERLAPLEWYRYGIANDEDICSQPPFIVWRFDLTKTRAETIDAVNRLVSEVVGTFQGNVEWVFEKSSRNWALTPKLVKDLEASSEFRTDVDILKYLMDNDPQFVQRANEDLPKIAQKLATMSEQREA